jgi:hypothetical protein
MEFLSVILDRNDRRHRCIEWEQVLELSSRCGETQAIREFKRSKGITYLVKAEDGRDNCISQLLELIKYGSENDLKAVMDSDGGATYKRMYDKKGKTHLEKIQDNIYCLREGKSRVYPVFLYPGTLTNEVKKATKQNLDSIRKKRDFEDVFSKFLDARPEWVDELIEFLIK